MNYAAAKTEAATKRILGVVVLVVAMLFLLAGLMLFLYTSLDGGSPALSSLSLALKRFVYGVYERTQFLRPIWNHAPAPNPNDLTSKGTVGFLGFYVVAFLGASLVRSGNRLAQRLRSIDREIEDQAIRESIGGGRRRTRTEIQLQVNVPKQSVWKEVHTLYVAPLAVGIVLWLIGKIFA